MTGRMISIGALKEIVEGRQDEATVVQVLGVRQLPGQEEQQLKEGKEAQEGKEGKEGKEASCQEG